SSVVSRQSSDKNNLKADSEASLKTDSSIIRVAAAYEIFHTAILAHDDIIDKSPERRGQQSLYQALGGDHRGISLAITLADAGFFLATKIISEADFPEKRKNEALKYFSSIMLNTAMGQILDIEKGDPLTVAKYKTAKYTVSGPLVLGAILAGARLDKLTQLDQFGEAVGIAFQIQDDILDGETKKYKQSLQQLDYFKNKALKIIPDITKDSKMSKILEQLTADLVNRIK
ncbi:polyprenyl synthetase family protein, partial [Patescibacteria group bacterium]|nr:polyprenyl synthetase family protein [Patescibacteria group bacterium]